MKLLHALVNIAAALKLSAIKHPLESRDINELYDKVDASLRECMNSTSMDVPLNVMKILRDSDKDGDEAIIVRQALAFVSGPLELCIAHDLTGLLGTAQISTHGTYVLVHVHINASDCLYFSFCHTYFYHTLPYNQTYVNTYMYTHK